MTRAAWMATRLPRLVDGDAGQPAWLAAKRCFRLAFRDVCRSLLIEDVATFYQGSRELLLRGEVEDE